MMICALAEKRPIFRNGKRNGHEMGDDGADYYRAARHLGI